MVAYYSKTFSPAQRNYCVTRRELLAVVMAAAHFRPYLYGRSFRLRTDHASLTWLYKRTEPSHQVARWLETLAEFNFTMEHRAGAKHGNADGLSRRCQDCSQCERIEKRDGGPRDTATPEAPSAAAVSLTGEYPPSEVGKLQDEEGTDVALVKAKLVAGEQLPPLTVETVSSELRRLAALVPHLAVKDRVLQLQSHEGARDKWLTVCPEALRVPLIWETHKLGHTGISRTIQRIKLHWYWPGMTGSIRRTVRTCEVCQAAKHSAPVQNPNRQRLHAGQPWQVVPVDHVRPFAEGTQGNTNMLALSDHFTRWRDAIAVPDGTAPVVARVLDERVFAYMGIPERIHTDQGAQFESHLMAELCALWGVDKSRTTPYHPQSNGVVERGNRDLGDALRSMLIGAAAEDWDLLLPHIMRGIRASPHATTAETPNYMMLGREVRLQDQLMYGPILGEELSRDRYALDLQERLTTAHRLLRDKQFTIRSEDHEEKPSFSVGDAVWLVSKRFTKGKSKKLQAKHTGPYKIVEVGNNHTYLIEQHGRYSRESESRLKAYIPATSSPGKAPILVEPTRQLLRPGRPRKVRADNSENNSSDHLLELMQNQRRGEIENTADVGEKDTQLDRCDDRAPSEHGEPCDNACVENEISKEESAGPSGDHPQRTRQTPRYLQDFDLTASTVHLCTSCERVNIGNNYSQKMAQAPGQPLIKPAEILDILEEGELPEVKEDGPKYHLNGNSVDTINVTDRTVSRISELYEQLVIEGRCTKRDCQYQSGSRERLKVHAESHYIIYVAQCSFFSSCRDSVRRHQTRRHPDSCEAIIQVDRRSWSSLRLEMKKLPSAWPTCPAAAKDYCSCVPASLEESRDRYRSMASSSRPTQIKICRVKEPDNSDNRVRQTERGGYKRKAEERSSQVSKRQRLVRELDAVESHINQLKSLIRYLEDRAVSVLANIKRLD